ncbi:MAG TPA: RraA family protein [Rhizomicrobium sp.]|nr:RraA family protein [Rhizomicrobium sp.]
MSVNAVSQSAIAQALRTSSASLHEAGGKIGALPSVLKPLSPDMRLCGRAFPVKSPSGDNLWLHHAIYAAAAGDVLVVDVGADPEFGYWGAIMTVAAQAQKLAGLVINGCVRDGQQVVAMNFPLFSTGLCIHGTGKDVKGAGSLGKAIRIGDATINAGDMVFGDADGVVVLLAASAAKIAEAAEQRDLEEAEIFRKLKEGQTTMQIYDLPKPAELEK